MAVTDAVKKTIGEKGMSMVLETLKAEGEAKGKVLAALEQRFNGVPPEVEDSIRSM